MGHFEITLMHFNVWELHSTILFHTLFGHLYYPPLGYAPGILATSSHPTWHLLAYIINQW